MLGDILSKPFQLKFKPSWSRFDTTWMLGLYGTAIGAGVLFLPISAGVGGLWPLIALALLALPMTFFAHRGLCRVALTSDSLADAIDQHFSPKISKAITLLYFIAIYPILLIYSVAITNTVISFIEHQCHSHAPPRTLIALSLILTYIGIIRLGEQLTVKTMSLLVYPFIIALLLVASSLIPHWSLAFLHQSVSFSSAIHTKNFYQTLWLAIPVIVFSFNHSPLISTFAVQSKKQYGDKAPEKCANILWCSHLLMVVSVLFFVFSCILSLTPTDLIQARHDNISILSYLANHFHHPMLAISAPLIAITAISKSFLGHYIGAREGFNNLILKTSIGKKFNNCNLNRITTSFMLLSTWLVATYNPSILGIIESLSGPVIAILLFIMPAWATFKIPALRNFRFAKSNIFIFLVGLITLLALAYKAFLYFC